MNFRKSLSVHFTDKNNTKIEGLKVGFPLFRNKIPFWKWNDPEIFSLNGIPGNLQTKWKPVYGLETGNFRNHVPEYRNVPEKFRFLFRKPEKNSVT